MSTSIHLGEGSGIGSTKTRRGFHFGASGGIVGGNIVPALNRTKADCQYWFAPGNSCPSRPGPLLGLANLPIDVKPICRRTLVHQWALPRRCCDVIPISAGIWLSLSIGQFVVGPTRSPCSSARTIIGIGQVYSTGHPVWQASPFHINQCGVMCGGGGHGPIARIRSLGSDRHFGRVGKLGFIVAE